MNWGEKILACIVVCGLGGYMAWGIINQIASGVSSNFDIVIKTVILMAVILFLVNAKK